MNIADCYKTFSLLDITSLEATDTSTKIRSMSSKIKNLPNAFDSNLTPAAICVYPVFADILVDIFAGTNIKSASVACGFPAGQIPAELKLNEVKYLVSQGIQEIDMVISRGKFLEKDYDYVEAEIRAVREICPKQTLKVIIESGELETAENIRKASSIAIAAGADFVKTSTGKSKASATPEAVQAICEAIKAHFVKTGKKVGIKISGGVSEIQIAQAYLTQIEKSLGKDWIRPQYCRIGASSLAGKLINRVSELTNNSAIYNYL